MLILSSIPRTGEGDLAKTTKKAKSEPKLTFHERALLSEKSKLFDPNASSEDCIEDLRTLQKEFPLKAITRNFYRHHGKYSDATWNQFFGTFHEYRRKAGLELSRGQHSFEKKIAIQANIDKYREFYKEEVLPYHEKYTFEDKDGRFKTLMICSDLHDLDLDMFCWSTFVDVATRIQPDIIILNGDIFDNYEFGRYDQDIRDVKILERFRFVKTHIFGMLRRVCPNTQIDFIIGNHDWRILKILSEKTPAMKVILSDVMGLTMSDVFGLDEFQINLIAKLDLAAYNNSDSEKELRENFKVYYNCFVVSHFVDLTMGLSGSSGHMHSAFTQPFSNIPMGKMTWVQTGCMCHTNSHYVEGRDKWHQSFNIVHIDTVSKSVQQEHCIFARDHIVVHGKRYIRE